MANFRTIGGGNVAVRYKTIATAAANQTYGQQLTQLKTTWNTLTDDEKLRCIIKFNNTNGFIFRCNSVIGWFVGTYLTATYGYMYGMLIQDCVYTVILNIGGSPIVENRTNNTNDVSLSLMLLCNY